MFLFLFFWNWQVLQFEHGIMLSEKHWMNVFMCSDHVLYWLKICWLTWILSETKSILTLILPHIHWILKPAFGAFITNWGLKCLNVRSLQHLLHNMLKSKERISWLWCDNKSNEFQIPFVKCRTWPKQAVLILPPC